MSRREKGELSYQACPCSKWASVWMTWLLRLRWQLYRKSVTGDFFLSPRPLRDHSWMCILPPLEKYMETESCSSCLTNGTKHWTSKSGKFELALEEATSSKINVLYTNHMLPRTGWFPSRGWLPLHPDAKDVTCIGHKANQMPRTWGSFTWYQEAEWPLDIDRPEQVFRFQNPPPCQTQQEVQSWPTWPLIL